MRKINKDTIKLIICSFDEDKKSLTTNEIIEKYNISRSSYFNILKKYNLKFNS